MAMWGESIDGAITGAASKYGVAPELLRTFAKIESSGRPNARTGSYKGLFQLSDSEFNKYGGSGNIFDPQANANAAAQKLAAQTSAFKAKYGRAPTPNDLYMIHQQGEGGYAAHTRNPNAPAWQNMYSTAEGRQKGPGWAKQAIWGNVPSDVRAKYPGGVDSLTSQQFLDLWNDKVNRMGSGMLGRALIGGRPEVEAGTGYVSGTGATPTGGPMPAQMPPEALTPPSGRYSKLADALMASAAGAKPRGWGDLLNASGDLALGYTLADKADTRQQEYQSKLSQMLSGADASALPDTLIQSGDPALMQAGVQAKMQQAQAQAKANAPLRGKERFMATPNGVMDVETMQIVPGTEKTATGNESFNKNIVYGLDAEGNTVPLSVSDQGRAVATQMPEGVSVGKDPIRVDAGDRHILLDPVSRQPIGEIKKNLAEAEEEKVVGKAQGEERVKQPALVQQGTEMLTAIDELLQDPALPSMTGPMQGRLPNVTGDASRVQSRINQLQGKLFLQAYQSLKGGGAISDFEAGKAEQALARVSDPSMSDSDYKQALTDLRDVIAQGVARAGGTPPAASTEVNALKQKYGLE